MFLLFLYWLMSEAAAVLTDRDKILRTHCVDVQKPKSQEATVITADGASNLLIHF